MIINYDKKMIKIALISEFDIDVNQEVHDVNTQVEHKLNRFRFEISQLQEKIDFLIYLSNEWHDVT